MRSLAAHHAVVQADLESLQISSCLVFVDSRKIFVDLRPPQGLDGMTRGGRSVDLTRKRSSNIAIHECQTSVPHTVATQQHVQRTRHLKDNRALNVGQTKRLRSKNFYGAAVATTSLTETSYSAPQLLEYADCDTQVRYDFQKWCHNPPRCFKHRRFARSLRRACVK